MDVIDRQAVRLIEIDDKSARNYQTYNLDDAYDDGFWNAIFAVLELPSAEPEIEEKLGFLEFLWNVINPNEMEQYMSMYQCGEEKIDG